MTSQSTLCEVGEMTRTKKKKYLLMCSGGKDSVATLILAWLNKEPLDEVVYVRVMFDKTTSGEHPEQDSYIEEVLKPWAERTLKVPFRILTGDKTYKELFNRTVSRGKLKGLQGGYLLTGLCGMNRDGKVNPVRDYMSLLREQGWDVYQYVGIAKDEPKRLERLNDHKISLLAKYGYTEKRAKALVEQYGLLSPVYEFSDRNGCFFCPNCKDSELANLINNNLPLFNKWLSLEYQAKKKLAYPYFKMGHRSLVGEAHRLHRQGLLNRRLVWVDFTGVKRHDEE